MHICPQTLVCYISLCIFFVCRRVETEIMRFYGPKIDFFRTSGVKNLRAKMAFNSKASRAILKFSGAVAPKLAKKQDFSPALFQFIFIYSNLIT